MPPLFACTEMTMYLQITVLDIYIEKLSMGTINN